MLGATFRQPDVDVALQCRTLVTPSVLRPPTPVTYSADVFGTIAKALGKLT
jgi:hypothetical protein